MLTTCWVIAKVIVDRCKSSQLISSQQRASALAGQVQA